MRFRRKLSFGLALVLLVINLTACDYFGYPSADNGKKNIVTTTTMLADLARQIAGDKANVIGLMGPGIDPHAYNATAGNVYKLQGADIVVVNGLHLEGKMLDVFENLDKMGKYVISLEKGIDNSLFITNDNVVDPHIWFDVTIWKEAAKAVAKGLCEADVENKAAYEANLNSYLTELDETHQYILDKVSEVPEESRVLVTAHDAFGYFAKAYGFEVRGIQGINTQAEAGTADIDRLAAYIAERKIKAVFVESSVSSKTTESLQAAVKAKGFDTAIGGELYSDSLGDEAHDADTYIKMVRKNIDTITQALK